MRSFERPLFIAAVAAIAVLSCARPSRCDQTTGSCAISDVVPIVIGEDFVLAPGARATVENLSVTFERVVSDSRCPADVVCVWAGNAAAHIIVRTAAEQIWNGQLNTNVVPETVLLDGYELRLVGVAPNRVSSAGVDPNDYRVTLRLTARKS